MKNTVINSILLILSFLLFTATLPKAQAAQITMRDPSGASQGRICHSEISDIFSVESCITESNGWIYPTAKFPGAAPCVYYVGLRDDTSRKTVSYHVVSVSCDSSWIVRGGTTNGYAVLAIPGHHYHAYVRFDDAFTFDTNSPTMTGK